MPDKILEVTLADDVVFRRIFEESPNGMALVDPSGRLLRANRALGRFLGRPTDGLVDLTITDITDPRDLGTGLELLGRLFEGSIDSYTVEKRYLRSDGASVWGRLTSWLLRDAAGGLLYGLDTIQDINAEKTAQAEAEQERRRLELALSVASIATWEIDLVTGDLTSSENLAEVYGAPVATIEEFLAHVDPADRDRVRRGLDAGTPSMATTVSATFRTVAVEGAARWIHVRGRVFRDERNRPVRMMGTGLDVTVTRNAIERRLRTERLHRRTLELVRDAYLAVGAGGRIVEWSDAATELFGWTAPEAIGRLRASDLFPDPTRPRWLFSRSIDLLDGDGAHELVETTAFDRTGRQFPVEIHAGILDDSDERLVHAFVRDSTARLDAERAVARATTTDPATGVANRAAVLGALETGRSLVLVRLEGMADVNRRFGFAAGDAALREAARRLETLAGDGAVVGRFGGTTFAFACATGARGAAIAGAVGGRFEDPVRLPTGDEVHLGTVVARVTATTSTTTADALVLEAESLLAAQRR